MRIVLSGMLVGILLARTVSGFVVPGSASARCMPCGVMIVALAALLRAKLPSAVPRSESDIESSFRHSFRLRASCPRCAMQRSCRASPSAPLAPINHAGLLSGEAALSLCAQIARLLELAGVASALAAPA